MEGLVDVVATIAGVVRNPDDPSSVYAVTKVFRFEFETWEDALNFLDTSEDTPGLVNAEELVVKAHVYGAPVLRSPWLFHVPSDSKDSS